MSCFQNNHQLTPAVQGEGAKAAVKGSSRKQSLLFLLTEEKSGSKTAPETYQTDPTEMILLNNNNLIITQAQRA